MTMEAQARSEIASSLCAMGVSLWSDFGAGLRGRVMPRSAG